MRSIRRYSLLRKYEFDPAIHHFESVSEVLSERGGIVETTDEYSTIDLYVGRNGIPYLLLKPICYALQQGFEN